MWSLDAYQLVNEHWLVVYSNSVDGTNAVGFDSASDPATYPSILKAIGSINSVTTPPLTLIVDNIHDSSLSKKTYLSITGFEGLVAHSSFNLPHLLTAFDQYTLQYYPKKHINMTFIDGNGGCVYSHTSSMGEVPCALNNDLLLQQSWEGFQIHYQPSAGFDSLIPRQAVWPIAFFGIIFSILSALLVRLSTYHRFELASQVAIRTEQLEQEKRNVVAAMYATERFIANMSHELRTPLNGIMGVNQILLAGPCNASTKRYLNVSQESAQHLLAVINDVLDISKLEDESLTISNQPFDLRLILEMVCSNLKIGCKDRPITPIIDLVDDLPNVVVGDAKRIKQVLLNLVSNALKFTDKGRIVFTVNAEYQADDTICLSFSVQDTGIGIPSELHQTVFERFKQIDDSNTRRHGGAGLGLCISHNLAQTMGGKLSLLSAEGEGSTFIFELALKASESKQYIDQPINTTLSDQRLRQRHIVLLDDVETNNVVTSVLLEQHGARVTTFNSPHQAIEFCANHADDIDTVLCDIQMPELDGLEVTRILRDLGFDKPIIGLSGNAYESDFNEAKKAGMNDYLSKPIDIVQCIGVLEIYLDLLPLFSPHRQKVHV